MPSLHCQASDKGPPGARACGSVTRGHAHMREHAHSSSIRGQGDELWRLNVSLSQRRTCAPMCVPVWCGRNAVGSPESENRAPGCLVPALFVEMKFQMLLGVLSASLLQNKWRQFFFLKLICSAFSLWRECKDANEMPALLCTCDLI